MFAVKALAMSKTSFQSKNHMYPTFKTVLYLLISQILIPKGPGHILIHN